MKEIQKFVFMRTYSRWNKDLKRRESFVEAVDRYVNFLREIVADKPVPEKVFQKIRQFMLSLDNVGSMRLFWSAGDAARAHNVSAYNCSFITMIDTRCFAEMMYILMCGCGCGFSCENKYISQLPEIKPLNKWYTPVVIAIGDNKESWADSIKTLMDSLYEGYDVEFDYSLIRPKGAKLKIMGGTASGTEPLINTHAHIREAFNAAQGRKLTDVEVNDICCQIAESVICGGVRRSALISLSDLFSEAMRHAKEGYHFPLRRHMANNSWVAYEKPDPITFMKEWTALAESGSGERGISNIGAYIRKSGRQVQGFNPCLTGDTIVAVADGRNGVSIKELAEESNGEIKFPVYSASKILSSNQFCEFKLKRWTHEIKNAVAFKSGTKKVIKILLSNGDTVRCTPDHLLGLYDGDWIRADESIGRSIEIFFSSKEKYRTIKSFTDGHSRQYRMMWEFNNGKKPYGKYCIDHMDENCYNDNISNLQLLTTQEHDDKSSNQHKGDGNQLHKAKYGYSSSHLGQVRKVIRHLSENGILINEDNYKEHSNVLYPGAKSPIGTICGLAPTFKTAKRYLEIFGFTDFVDILKTDKIDKTYLCNEVVVVDIIDEGEVEDVYDLTVEDNHNFYIITKGFDGKFLESRGILVHNCHEIGLKTFGFCNLSETIVRPEDDIDSLLKKVDTATWIGMIQSTLTNFEYLRPEWKHNCETDRLLGVSLTGQMDNTAVLTEDNLKALRAKCWKVARKAAKILDISEPTAISCGKPSGTTSLLVNSSSGCHTHWSKWYIRRIRINYNDPLTKLLISQGMKWQPENGQETMAVPNLVVFEFPMAAPKNAVTRHDVDAIGQLEWYKKVQTNWCDHNQSITVYVKSNEWLKVGHWVFENWENVVGVAFLPDDGGNYKLAPLEEITEEQYNEMVKSFPAIDYSKLNLFEKEDNTEGAKNYACTGDKCTL